MTDPLKFRREQPHPTGLLIHTGRISFRSERPHDLLGIVNLSQIGLIIYLGPGN